jgi:biotin transport system substrate-specific component
MIERSWSRLDVWRGFGINVLGGIVVMYMCGIPWIAVVAEISLWQAFIGVMGFLPGDVVKAAVAAFVAITVKRSYPIIGQAETGRA